MFKGIDAPVLLKNIENFLPEHQLNCRNITINITQDMLNTMSHRELVNFSSAIRSFGFKLGLFGFDRNFCTLGQKSCFKELY